MHDSRRYHRRRRPSFTRAQASGGFSTSNPVMFDPFGSAPFRQSGEIANQFTNPTAQQLGFGGGPNSPYGRGQGPYGSFLSQVQSPLSSYLPTMTNLSNTITQGANSSFGGYQAAVDSFMSQLPGFNASAGQATNAASTALSDAMSPLQSRAAFQEASRRALAPAREGAAARGMLEGGQAQGGEQSLLGDLAFNTLQSDRAAQQNAIAGLSGATTNQANIAGLGPQVTSALFSAFPQLASILQGAAGMPMQAGNTLLNFFQQAMNPGMSLLSLIKPQMGQHSFSFNQSGGI